MKYGFKSCVISVGDLNYAGLRKFPLCIVWRANQPQVDSIASSRNITNNHPLLKHD